jgi:quinolinate synthase
MEKLEEMTEAEIDEEISQIKRKYGNELFMPVHHYQRDEVEQFADRTGDSLELSRVSAGTTARFIVFCGVYFMAEIARILASGDKYVFIPDRDAGCPLADFASEDRVGIIWDILQRIHPDEYIPVTYANSTAAVKAFCGRNRGLVCTSSNAKKIFSWILDQGKRVFFMPDKNLGINTARELGLEGEYCVADRYPENIPGWVDEDLRGKRIVMWDGFCVVHRAFRLKHVAAWRELDPDARIIVHPECDPEVVDASDYSGSTAKIKKMVEESERGSRWVIGTEYNMVHRLQMNNPDKIIEPLERSVCRNMSKINRRNLLQTLLSVEKGDYSDQVVVGEKESSEAKHAITRMLALS